MWKLTALFILALLGCSNENSVITEKKGLVKGKVFETIDGEEVLLSGITVSIGSESYVTTQNGLYQFNQISTGSKTLTAGGDLFNEYSADITVLEGENEFDLDLTESRMMAKVYGRISSQSGSVLYATYSNELELKNIISDFKVDRLKDGGHFPSYLAVDSEGNFYIQNSYDEYLINKYNMNGELELSFGRESYKRKSNTNKYRKWFEKARALRIKFGGTVPKLPKFPPIVSYIIVDDRDLIWIITGESNITSGLAGWETVSTIDIFNTTGKFLYSFEA